MAQIKVELSVCRFRKTLSSGQGTVTMGGGCVVRRESNGGVFLITTTQVVTMEDLVSTNNGISVEFLGGGNKKLLSFDLDCKDASGIPGPILLPGRVLEHSVDSAAEAKQMLEVSFIIIPVQKFDNRHAIVKKFLPFNLEKKRPITCSYQSGADLKSSISTRQVLCHVICDDRKDDKCFNTEPYCLEFCADTKEFSLTSPLGRDHGDVINSFIDFHKEEKPRGAVLLNSEGKFVGMLGMDSLDERKLFPLFLTLEDNGDAQQCREGDQAVPPVEESTPSDQATTSETNSQNFKTRSTSDGDQTTENECCTSMVQGSSNADTAGSLMLVDCLQSVCLAENQTVSSSLPTSGQDLDPADPQNGQQRQEDNHDQESQPDGMEGSFSNTSSLEINEDADPEHSGPKLATQNSYYDQSLSSEEGYGVPETASQPPKKGETPPPFFLPSSSESVNSPSTEADRKMKPRRSQSDVFGPGTSSQGPRSGIMKRSGNMSAKHAQLRHISAGSYVKDNIVNRAEIMDVLTLHLDRSVLPCRGVTQRWEHLADKFKVPDDIKRQCENFTGSLLSPSEALFEFLCTYDSITIETLKGHLKKMGRNDIILNVLEKSSNLKDEHTVTDLCENHPETLCSVCLRLDDKRSIKNWHDLGIEIGISADTLRRLKDPSGCSPSKAVFRKIQTLKPRLPITKLVADIKKPGVARVLDTLPGGSTIETLIDDIDVFEKVTDLLDTDEKAWQRLGRLYGMETRVLDNLKPDPFQSPTKVVMEYIVQNEPALNMKTFLKSLESIERFDVIADLKDFFYADDFDGIWQAEGPAPL